MNILSGFKSFEKYLTTEEGYQLVSERQLAKDVLLNNGNNVENIIAIIQEALPFRIEIDDTAKTINFIDR